MGASSDFILFSSVSPGICSCLLFAGSRLISEVTVFTESVFICAGLDSPWRLLEIFGDILNVILGPKNIE